VRTLGIDPGMAITGYGLVESNNDEISLVDCGAFTTPPRAPVAERLRTLYLALVDLLARWQPNEVAVEEPFVAANVRSALAVGQARAIAILAAANAGLPVYQYTPNQVKRSIANYGHSNKEQVQEMVRLQLGLATPPQPYDAADALAIALCHIWESRLARLISEREERR
jgi:crossover junction endodeoxyribonuclease RuvC